MFNYCVLAEVSANSASQNTPRSDGRFEFTSAENWPGFPAQIYPENLLTGDFNGDGASDLVYRDPSATAIWVSTSSPSGRFNSSVWSETGFLHSPWMFDRGDFNKDGKTDLLIYELSGFKTWILYSEGVRFSKAEQLQIFADNFHPIEFTVVDWNEDGYADIHARDAGAVHENIYIRSGDKFNLTYSGLVFGEYLRPYVTYTAGGMTADFLVSSPSFTHWQLIRIARPFGERVVRDFSNFQGKLKYTAAYVGDFNGDSKTDLLIQGTNVSGWWAGLSDGENGIEVTVSGPFPVELKVPASVVGDFNGDRLHDLLWFNPKNHQLMISLAKLKPLGRPTLGNNLSILGDPAPGPYVCLGYNSGLNGERWGMARDACPKNYAFYSIDDASRGIFKTREIPVEGWCCPLPFSDILTEEHVFVSEECPSNYVVTGGKNNYSCLTCPQLLRCTKINTKRYQLGPDISGSYWGDGLSMRLEQNELHKQDIPLAIRHGIGRVSYNHWDSDGCIAVPWGGLLVKRGNLNCASYIFKELQFLGNPGDPVKGTAVKMFPDCTVISNIFDPLTGCEK